MLAPAGVVGEVEDVLPLGGQVGADGEVFGVFEEALAGRILPQAVGEAGHGVEPAPVDGEGAHAVEGLYPRIDTAAAGACRHGDARSVLSPFGSQCARWCPQQGGKPPRSLAPREVRSAIASRSVREERPGMRPAVAMENGQR